MSESDAFASTRLDRAPVVLAPDGSEVRVLCAAARGSLAVFTLPPGAVARAVRHRTVEEVWFVLAGEGRIWRRIGDAESTSHLTPGVAFAIAADTTFQFRCDGAAPLQVVATTMPPWPGEDEAVPADGPWAASV